jgi:AcrR family transcriptional regulator
MQARSEATKQHILEAASQLFSQSGYDAAGVAEICKAAGISKGAFYYHFPSKQAVFLALLDQWLENLDLSFSPLRLSSGGVADSILQMARMAAQILPNAQDQITLLLEFWLQARRDPVIWQAAIAPYRRYQAYFTDFFAEGIARGEFQDVDPSQAARGLVSLAIGLMMQVLFDPQGVDWSDEVPQTVQSYLDGISRRQA